MFEKKELLLEEIKDIELKILLEIHDICVKNNFRYSLCGGTLLGAIRHNGFIHWDDDIDISIICVNMDQMLITDRIYSFSFIRSFL